MSAQTYPHDVIDQGHSVLEAWRSIDPALKVGDLAPEALEAVLNQVSQNTTKINRIKAESSEAHNERKALSQDVWDKIKRVRRGIQAIYGDDSSQFDIVGGTRVSDRKSNARKAVAPPPPPASN